ncbi:hypothetical protein MKW94_013079 [Papaver nudicaule]|uniref:Uncharacterized protein n=1 Tax=Papaver nudicaule TaxID=74823 RepID=A0AA41SP95_PAPNU|nr:hypothetical protein [Papaver nudicaule]
MASSSSVMTLVINNLTQVIDLLSLEFIGMQIVDIRDEIKKLDEAVHKIEPILEDAEEKQLGDEQIAGFLRRIRDCAWEIEDLLDELVSFIPRRGGNTCTIVSKVCSSVSPSLGFAILLFGKCKTIRTFRKKLKKLESESSDFDLVSNAVPPPLLMLPNDYSGTRNSVCVNSCEDDCVVYGRESEKLSIMNMLLEVDNREVHSQGVRVVSIVGIGGIGKTTLAKSVYNHGKVKSHFDTRLWISVPQTASSYLEMTVGRILEALSLSGDDTSSVGNLNGADMTLLSSLLSDRINQKKFLLVLDDVWNEDIRDWQPLKSLLGGGAPGSSILLLTRNKAAAYLMSTTILHELQPLSKESSWELFSRYAFRKLAGDALKPFEDIGRIVSQRCNGVPLAIKCLGCLLRTKTTRQEWEDIMESDKWELLEMEPILPALYFSYYSLPPVLKLCLSYTAIFPKAYEIDKGTLIKMWMAEGFLNSSTAENRDPEWIGEECFRELIMRSYFNSHNMDKGGQVISIKMHDLVHDLAASMSGHSVMQIDNTTSKLNKARHLSVLHTDLDSITSSVKKANHVSTLKLFECSVNSGTVSPHLFAHLKFLKVLDFSYLGLAELPNQVGELKHLRYLNLSHANIQSLPEKMCELHSLQILILSHCEQISSLPRSLGNIRGLRHLALINTPKLQYFPRGIGRLTELRTLSKFVIASSSRKGAKIGELKELNLLQGHLEISGLSRVKSGSDAMKANMVKKKHLQSLCLNFECDPVQTEEAVKIMENVLEALKPIPELQSNVEVRNYISSKYPSWMSPSDSDQTQKNMDCVEELSC